MNYRNYNLGTRVKCVRVYYVEVTRVPIIKFE